MNIERIKKWGLLALILVFSFVLVIGCSSSEETDGQEPDASQSEVVDNTAETVQEEDSSFPITIKDGAGQEVTIESEPTKIVSLLASNTEIAFALGLGDKIVGVSDWCNYPAEVEQKERLGGQEFNIEKILSLQPDVALVSMYHFTSQNDTLQKLRDAGIKVIVAGDATSFEDVYATIRLIAQATGSTEKGEEIIAGMQSKLDELKSKAQAVTEKKKVWVEVSPAPDIYTTGQHTFMHEMLEAIQAINAAGEQSGWVKFTEEEAVVLNPDVIITTYGYYIDQPAEQVLSRAGWAEVPAIKNKQVFDVENDTVTRPGPRLIEGVETLAKFIYPEIYQ